MEQPSNGIRLSAAVITLNEQHNLPGLLERLGWVDEVVVVDGGSSDQTLALARGYGARVWQHRFDDYARQRNRALNKCRGEWVLSVDADERPTEAMREEIARRIAEPAGCVAFRVPIRSTILGRRFRYSGTQDDRPIRLFRRDGVRWEGEVHEVPVVRGAVGELRNGLEHHTLPNMEALLVKLNRYTTLEALARVRAASPWRVHDLFWQPARETLRRLIWKRGILDGPRGWLFCGLSGLYALVAHLKHGEMLRGESSCASPRVPEAEAGQTGPANPASESDAMTVGRREAEERFGVLRKVHAPRAQRGSPARTAL